MKKPFYVYEEHINLSTGNQLKEKFERASKEELDELDFFIELIEEGFTLDDIKNYLPDRYEYAKSFMEEHGLI